MRSKANPMSVEGMRQDFINELRSMGIEKGREGQVFQNRMK